MARKYGDRGWRSGKFKAVPMMVLVLNPAPVIRLCDLFRSMTCDNSYGPTGSRPYYARDNRVEIKILFQIFTFDVRRLVTVIKYANYVGRKKINTNTVLCSQWILCFTENPEKLQICWKNILKSRTPKKKFPSNYKQCRFIITL